MTTPNKGLTTPAYNSTSPTWDNPLNTNFGIIDTALGGTLSVALASSNVALSAANIQNLRVLLTGSLSANVQVSIPAGVGGFWIFSNGTSGAFSVTATSAGGGASVVLPQGYSSLVYSDGTNVGLADNGTSSLSAVPPGTWTGFAGPTPPSGYLLCDGTAYSRSTYSALYTAIGTTWGVGDGSTTFNVPDFRGVFLRGAGAGRNPSPRAVGSYEADSFAAHTHSITDPGHAHHSLGTVQGAGPGGSYPTWSSYNTAVYNIPSDTVTTGITGANSTGGAETVPKNYATLFIIKT